MDNASFIATLAPDLRDEVLLSADEAFLASLPPHIQSEALTLRERAYRNFSRFSAGRAALPRALGGPPPVPITENTKKLSVLKARNIELEQKLVC